MGVEANKATVRSFYEMGNRGDFEACLALIAEGDQPEQVEPGRHGPPVAGTAVPGGAEGAGVGGTTVQDSDPVAPRVEDGQFDAAAFGQVEADQGARIERIGPSDDAPVDRDHIGNGGRNHPDLAVHADNRLRGCPE